MTDKEKLDAVVTELRRRIALFSGLSEDTVNPNRIDEDRQILSFIDSMQEESSSSVWHDKEEKPYVEKRIFAICVLDKLFAGYYYEINPRYIRRWAYVEDLIKL